MEAKALFRNIRRGARKIRPVVDLVRGKMVTDALNILSVDTKSAALDVSKLVRSAVANAMQKGGVRSDTLYIKSIFVDEAPMMKRIMPRARGSADRIEKKLSHITVILDEKI